MEKGYISDVKVKYGFTLVELVVIIGVVAFLTTIGFISFTGYIASSKDAMRMTQIANLNDTLEMYKLRKALPLPDSPVQVKDGTELIAYQGYAGYSVLSSLGVEIQGGDFKDGFFYSYYVTKSRRNFQLLTFLEDGTNMNSTSFIPNVSADSSLYPYVAGDTLGVVTDTNNTPIQDIEAIKTSNFDIAGVSDQYIMYFTNTEKLQGGVEIMHNIKTAAHAGGKYCKVDGNGVSCDDPNISQYQKYPDCPAGTINSPTNDGVYNYGFVNNSISVKVTGVETIENGTNSYSALMYCDKGLGAISSENLIGTVCNQGYNWNGVHCEPPDLYAFTSHTFTNCSATGKNGPLLTDCRGGYNTIWDENNSFYNHVTGSQGYQLWTVPSTATYTIDAYGGSSEGRKGARLQGNFSLVKGEQLIIVVGQKGTRLNNHGEGGAGGTFIMKANSLPANVTSVIPLLVAGGAGGRGDDGSCGNTDAYYLTTAGKSSCNSKAGGINGTDGYSSLYGGKGLNSFSNLVGKNGEDGGQGGFGGGGGAQDDADNGGGGGGYSGGGGAQGGNKQGGGGGGSYNAGMNQEQGLASSVNTQGYVTITKN